MHKKSPGSILIGSLTSIMSGDLFPTEPPPSLHKGKMRTRPTKKAKRRHHGKYQTRTPIHGTPRGSGGKTYYKDGGGRRIWSLWSRDRAKVSLDLAVVYAKRVKRWFKNNDPNLTPPPRHILEKAKFVRDMDAQIQALDKERTNNG